MEHIILLNEFQPTTCLYKCLFQNLKGQFKGQVCIVEKRREKIPCRIGSVDAFTDGSSLSLKQKTCNPLHPTPTVHNYCS